MLSYAQRGELWVFASRQSPDRVIAVNRLAWESDERRPRVLLRVAGAPPGNFHENWMPGEMVADDLAEVRLFPRNLEGLL